MTLLRHEDKRLITGTGKFTADWNIDGQLHAFVVRSDRAHAELLSVDTESAKSIEGVVAVYTAADVTAMGYSSVPAGPVLKGVDGCAVIKNPMPLLAIDRVRFVGQAVAVVVASRANIAQQAAEQIQINYRELQPLVTPEQALEKDAIALHTSAQSNTSLVYESGDRQLVEQAFAKADRVTSLTIASQRLAGAPIEPRAVLVDYDLIAEKTIVYTPTQGLLGMRASLAAITGLNSSEFDIVTEDVGGSFGLRGGPTTEHGLLVLAANQLKRPIKWVAQRSELFIGEWHGRGLTLAGSIALDSNDRITAIQFEDTVDLGAYNCYFGGFIGTGNLSVTMGGAYQVPALYMRSTLVYTNTVPVSAYRGAGRPDIAYAIERLVDQAVAEHHLDPVDFRRKNFIPRDAFPYTTANGSEYD